MDAVILAAGRATRLGALKALLDVRGEPLVGRLVRQLRALGLPVTVVTGHRADEVEAGLAGFGARFVRNPRATGLAGSCAVGLDAVQGDALVVLGDNVTEPALFRRVLDAPGELVLAWTDVPVDDESMKIQLEDGRPSRLSKATQGPVAGEFTGVFAVRGTGRGRLRAALAEHGPDVDLCEGPLNAVMRLATSIDVSGIPWIEIDFPGDVARMSAVGWSLPPR